MSASDDAPHHRPSSWRIPLAEIDRQVSRRIRARRIALGLTQHPLAQRIGVTYQQLHKYEVGANRVSAGRLEAIARALGVDVADFFVGQAGQATHTDALTLEFIRACVGIGDQRHQRALALLVRLLALRASTRGELKGGIMADKSSFTTDEWKKLIEAPMLAAIAVTAADPSGLWGTLKEGFAASGTLAKVKADAGADPLIKAIAAEYETSEGRGIARDGLKARLAGGRPAAISSKAVAALGEVAALLDAKASGNAAAVRGWLASISQAVAEASKEGGFLGFGGVQVSDAEKATIAQVAAALKTTA